MIGKIVDGVEQHKWSQTRWFECTRQDHVGKKVVNRDHNASRNIAWNVICIALGNLNHTTWMIAKMED